MGIPWEWEACSEFTGMRRNGNGNGGQEMGGNGNCSPEEIPVSHANHIFGRPIMFFNGLA